MRRLILALLPGLALACSDDTIATGTADSTSDTTSGTTDGDPTGNPSSTPTVPTTDPTTGSASESNSDATTHPGTATSDPTVTTDTPDTTTDTPDTTTEPGTTTTSDTSTTDTTTGGDLCGADGPVIEATLMHDVVPDCGPIEFTGQNQMNNAGPVYALDGCPCGANCIIPDPWTFTIDAPADWGPGFLPKCPRIIVERQKSKQGCELVGVAIWDAQELEGSAALYHAGSLLGPIQAVVGQIGLEQVTVNECACDGCCSPPALLDLNFTALKTEALISEGQEGMLGDADLGYKVKNFQSHLSGICDDSPAIDWVAKRVGKP